jgi:outer membrane murein-binding lipoprotein Lpp
MKQALSIALVLIGLTLIGCATASDQETLRRKVDTLEKKVAELESAKKATAEANSLREAALRGCLAEAERIYWAYVKLNGTDKGNGNYSATQYVWDQARQRKLDKIEECKLLYPSK